ncbi:MAG: hypothetical protein DCC63_17525 [Nitrospira sp.]|nr:MAG: hypothetical protein HRU82_18485 [Nitrospira sp.]RIK56372.1 MAG: hypothetical protein DCC63_17525 [Nitrospira sp.]
MPLDHAITTILSHPGTLAFPSNRAALQAAAVTTVRRATGHLIVYGDHGRRLLATDPGGHPLHECEWGTEGSNLRLTRARVQLDWGAWVGLVPGGLVNEMGLDLSRKPGWQRLRADDLRGMAAQALEVPLDEIRFFYSDQDMTINVKGTATIRHRKDAIFFLPGGTFDEARFMACMGAMHWEAIDFLPVVELFLSLLPGTGSALFELIRGLYDDQNQGTTSPRILRYRGIPTYPSEAAYRLFSQFFAPQLTGGGNPFPLFMDPPRSHMVTWTPVADPPRRYMEPSHHLCVTIQGRRMLKATCWDDAAGLSYHPLDRAGLAPCRRGLAIEGEQVLLTDGNAVKPIPLQAGWGPVTEPAPSEPAPSFMNWQELFSVAPPSVSPSEAFGAVLLYPEDEQEIGELPTQPFVADYLQDLIEQDRTLAVRVARAGRQLIRGFDAAVTACLPSDRPRACTVLYRHPAFAQRQAQALWNLWARAQRLDWLAQVRMKPCDEGTGQGAAERYDLAHDWIPFAHYEQPEALTADLRSLADVLSSGATAFLVGPRSVPDFSRAVGLVVQAITPVADLPTFRMHQSVLPRARLKPGVILYQLTLP